MNTNTKYSVIAIMLIIAFTGAKWVLSPYPVVSHCKSTIISKSKSHDGYTIAEHVYSICNDGNIVRHELRIRPLYSEKNHIFSITFAELINNKKTTSFKSAYNVEVEWLSNESLSVSFSGNVSLPPVFDLGNIAITNNSYGSNKPLKQTGYPDMCFLKYFHADVTLNISRTL